jgi:hypothetical protein
MQEAGLVRNKRRGRENVWQLDPRRLQDARHYLHLISEQWDQALGRLRKFVKNDWANAGGKALQLLK